MQNGMILLLIIKNSTFQKIGHWWDTHTELDIGAIDSDDNNLVLGECKFWQEPVGISVLRGLEDKASILIPSGFLPIPILRVFLRLRLLACQKPQKHALGNPLILV